MFLGFLGAFIKIGVAVIVLLCNYIYVFVYNIYIIAGKNCISHRIGCAEFIIEVDMLLSSLVFMSYLNPKVVGNKFNIIAVTKQTKQVMPPKDYIPYTNDTLKCQSYTLSGRDECLLLYSYQ